MNTLLQNGIRHIYHVCPINYLPSILHSGELRCKKVMLEKKVPISHFRRTTHQTDIKRGFLNAVHLTTSKNSGLLRSKLRDGYPHFQFVIKTEDISKSYDLCRYNIAKMRNHLFGKKPIRESERNGRYYDRHVPIARTVAEQEALLSLNKNATFEVLVPDSLHLPTSTQLMVFSEEDMAIVDDIRSKLGIGLPVMLEQDVIVYNQADVHRHKAMRFLDDVLKNPDTQAERPDFDYLR